MNKRRVILAAVAAINLMSAATAMGAKPNEGIAVLAVTRTPAEGWLSGAHYAYIARPWVNGGGTMDVCHDVDLPARLATGKFNVVVWTPQWDLTSYAGIAQFKKELPPVRQAVDDFLAKGGGLLILGSSDQYITLATHALTERWGARMLVETVEGPGRVSFAPGWDSWLWSYTTKVSGPAAPGVKGVWFPCSGPKWVWPLEVDDHWQVVVRGEPGTTSTFSSWSADVDKVRRKISFIGGVPIAAVRALDGGGRVALCGVPHTYSFESPHIFVGAEAFLFRGIGGKPSDGRTMLFNLIRWLGEPSKSSGKLGGATTPDRVLKPWVRFKSQPAPPVRWEQGQAASLGRPFRGLIGARTTLSTGKSTAQEFVAAAKAAGLEFLFFLEDHKAMTPEKSEQLRKECERLSDAAFQAVAGYTIEDEFGNHWFVAGPKAIFPPDDCVSPDKKVLAGTYDNVGLKHTKPGQAATPLGRVMNHITEGPFQYQVMVGSWNHKKASMPPWDYRDHSAAALVTTDESGKVIDDLSQDYPLIQQKGNDLQPFAIERMTSADQVAQRARTGYLTYVWGNDLRSAVHGITTVGTGLMFISNGPQILDWQIAGNAYPSVINDDYRSDLYHARLQFHVASDAGLEEVCLHDGSRCIRRFLPQGAKEFARTVDLYNVPQQELILSVRDTSGRRAVSKNLQTRAPDFQENMCGDRNNQIAQGFSVRSDGSAFREAPPTGVGLTPDKGPAKWSISPCFPYAFSDRAPACPWDGGTYTSGYSIQLVPRIDVAGEPERKFHNSSLRALISPDVMVGTTKIDGGYPDEFSDYISSVWNTIYPVVPTRYVEGQMRMTYWKTKPDCYTCTLWEATLRFKKGTRLAEQLPVVIGQVSSGVDDCDYTICDADGTLHRGKSKQVAKPFHGVLNDTGYVSFYNETSNSMFFPQVKGVRYMMYKGAVVFYLSPKGGVVKAGDEFPIKFICIGTAPVDEPNAPVKVDKTMGITTGKPAYSLKLEQGKVVSQRYVLGLAAQAGGAGGVVAKADLPAVLPVTVSSLNPNWTVVYVDRGTGKWRPVGQTEGTAYVRLDPTAGDQSFYIGHPVVCDRPELILQLTQTGKKTWNLEVHNPTENSTTAAVSFVPGFLPLSHKPLSITAGAGQSVFTRIEK